MDSNTERDNEIFAEKAIMIAGDYLSRCIEKQEVIPPREFLVESMSNGNYRDIIALMAVDRFLELVEQYARAMRDNDTVKSEPA